VTYARQRHTRGLCAITNTSSDAVRRKTNAVGKKNVKRVRSFSVHGSFLRAAARPFRFDDYRFKILKSCLRSRVLVIFNNTHTHETRTSITQRSCVSAVLIKVKKTYYNDCLIRGFYVRIISTRSKSRNAF